jgi:pyruvate/2-oxoglutarate dehydrogenase complex dihydrolipoamide acyltransferase (E2) component
VSSSRTDTVVEVTMPQMGVSVVEGTIVEWHVSVGDAVAAEQTICEITTDKIDTEVPAPADGVVESILVEVGSTVDVGTVLARIDVSSSGQAGLRTGPVDDVGDSTSTLAESDVTPPARSASAESAAVGNGDGRRYSPVVQRIAAEHGIDLAQVRGTGRDGRVRKQDVLAFVEAQAGAVAEPPLHIESPYRPDPSPAAEDAGTLSRMRRQIGAHMKRSLETAATCTSWMEADMTRVEAARRNARVGDLTGITALPIVARCAIEALQEHPALNATLDGERYTRHREVNLGIAVSLGEDGLIVPVIHGAHELSVEGLAARIRDLARRARAGRLDADEVQGGTFTITNPGQYGTMMATPVINQPQVAILDLEAIVKRPVVVTGEDGSDMLAIRSQTILGLSWDHRALDGALAAHFLGSVRRRLESWDGG